MDIPHERLPEPIEAGAYYLIAEALTNVTKYAHASIVHVRIDARKARFIVEISTTASAERTPRMAPVSGGSRTASRPWADRSTW